MDIMEARAAKVDAVLDDWIDDANVVAREVVDDFGTVVAVVEDEDGFRVLRAFALGDGADVSVDLETHGLEGVVQHLVEHYKV